MRNREGGAGAPSDTFFTRVTVNLYGRDLCGQKTGVSL